MSKNGTKPAVGYIRMSTDKQEDSPARQRRDIESLARQTQKTVEAVYKALQRVRQQLRACMEQAIREQGAAT